jgi:hypothetical protein
MDCGRQALEVRVLTGTVSVTRVDGMVAEPTGNTAPRLLSLLVSRADLPVSMSEIVRAV